DAVEPLAAVLSHTLQRLPQPTDLLPRLLQLAGEASDLDALHVHTPARSLYGVDEIGQRGSGVYDHGVIRPRRGARPSNLAPVDLLYGPRAIRISVVGRDEVAVECHPLDPPARRDRKSTRLNSSHV